jgi:hypothetical protein
MQVCEVGATPPAGESWNTIVEQLNTTLVLCHTREYGSIGNGDSVMYRDQRIGGLHFLSIITLKTVQHGQPMMEVGCAPC